MDDKFKKVPMCPIRRYSCERENCSWWCKTKEKCAVYMIADGIDAIRDKRSIGYRQGPM